MNNDRLNEIIAKNPEAFKNSFDKIPSLMLDVLDMQKFRKMRTAAVAIQEKDCSRYGFYFDSGALKAQDVEVILILLTVAQLIPCEVVKAQIREAVDNDELKDWILLDVLTECDETFFPNDIKAKTFKNVTRMDEKDLVDAFTQIANQISY